MCHPNEICEAFLVWPFEGSGCSELGGEVQDCTSHVDQADWGLKTTEEVQEIESWQREEGGRVFPFLTFISQPDLLNC